MREFARSIGIVSLAAQKRDDRRIIGRTQSRNACNPASLHSPAWMTCVHRVV